MDDLSERLFTHFIGGRWRVPLSTQQLLVTGDAGQPLGRVVIADARDIARAQALMRGADRAGRQRLAACLEQVSPAMAAAVDAARSHAAPRIVTDGLDRPDRFGAALGAGLGSGVLWCPPLSVAGPATRIALAAQEADLPPGSFALLHALTAQTLPLLRATGLPICAADQE